MDVSVQQKNDTTKNSHQVSIVLEDPSEKQPLDTSETVVVNDKSVVN